MVCQLSARVIARRPCTPLWGCCDEAIFLVRAEIASPKRLAMTFVPNKVMNDEAERRVPIGKCTFLC